MMLLTNAEVLEKKQRAENHDQTPGLNFKKAKAEKTTEQPEML